ncbi:MAG TPA: hypothetical protein VN224_02475, partial [Xanthomonadales bacterium]|nr:hypothetical protein [Xanthomonadales bacterium]
MTLIAVSVSACGTVMQTVPNAGASNGSNDASNVAPSWDKKSIVMVVRPQPSTEPTAQPTAQPAARTGSVITKCPLSAPGRRAVSTVCCDGDCPPPPTPTPRPVALAQIVISVPAPTAQNHRPLSARKQPRYVSAATNSAQITLSAPAAGYPSSYSTDCVPNPDGTKTCTINNVGAQPATNETFTASVFTGAAETGSLLGKG